MAERNSDSFSIHVDVVLSGGNDGCGVCQSQCEGLKAKLIRVGMGSLTLLGQE